MSAITAKASRKMKKYAVLTREPRCFLGSFDFSWEQRKFGEVFDCTVPNNTLSRVELSYDEVLAPGAHSQFGSGKNTQFEPEQRANPFENVFSKTAVFPPPAIAETDL